MTAHTAEHTSADAFRHEAFLYTSEAELVDRTAAFVRDGLRADEPVMVALRAIALERLSTALAGDASRVHLVDMEDVGRNPARIIPAWSDFLEEHAPSSRLRGVGEPVWAGRSTAELVECRHHEALLNQAFDGGRPWWLLCPYDVSRLDPAVIGGAYRTHPHVRIGDTPVGSPGYRPDENVLAWSTAPLPEPPRRVIRVDFAGASALEDVRRCAARVADAAGLDGSRADDLVLAVHEIATNSIRHGGGGGTFQAWRDGASLVCEVTDRGHIDQPLVGRVRPGTEQTGGRGMWMANRLCDLVQIRVREDGTVVRLHTTLAGPRSPGR